MRLDDCLRLRSEALRWRQIDGEIVALERRTAVFLAANRAAGVLWPLLARGSTQTELTTSLVREFGIGELQAAADVKAFVHALRERELLEPASTQGPAQRSGCGRV